MAHLWVRDVEEQWAVLPLDGIAFSLSLNPPRAVNGETVSGAVLLKSVHAGSETWVLVTGAESVSVNGRRVALGMRVVKDLDKISVEGVGTYFFSTESLASVKAFPGSEQKIFCPRCRQDITAEVPAVQCPQCGVWYHQTEELPCWTYSERCALCPQTTAMEAGYKWTPEDL